MVNNKMLDKDKDTDTVTSQKISNHIVSLNGIEITFKVDEFSPDKLLISVPPSNKVGSYYSISIDCVASNALILGVNGVGL